MLEESPALFRCQPVPEADAEAPYAFHPVVSEALWRRPTRVSGRARSLWAPARLSAVWIEALSCPEYLCVRRGER
jgi:hypothetical protein